MSRNIQKNPWGQIDGFEPQRSDLWIVDFRSIAQSLNNTFGLSVGTTGGQLNVDAQALSSYQTLNVDDDYNFFITSISLPELKIKSETVRRDSRAYQMPSWDEPVETARLTFLLDANMSGNNGFLGSRIYRLLSLWRMIVRAGRGGVGSELAIIRLDSTYRIEYAYNIAIRLLRGGSGGVFPASTVAPSVTPAISGLPAQRGTTPNTLVSTANQQSASGFGSTDLKETTRIVLENAWLSSFKISELSQENSKPATIEAQFYVENVLEDQYSKSQIVPQ